MSRKMVIPLEFEVPTPAQITSYLGMLGYTRLKSTPSDVMSKVETWEGVRGCRLEVPLGPGFYDYPTRVSHLVETLSSGYSAYQRVDMVEAMLGYPPRLKSWWLSWEESDCAGAWGPSILTTFEGPIWHDDEVASEKCSGWKASYSAAVRAPCESLAWGVIHKAYLLTQGAEGRPMFVEETRFSIPKPVGWVPFDEWHVKEPGMVW